MTLKELKRLKIPELRDLRNRVDFHLHRLEQEELAGAVVTLQKVANRRGQSLMELVREIDSPAGRKKLEQLVNPYEAKYQHPNNPDLVWSGRGHPPRWIEAYESTGGNREHYRVAPPKR